MPVVSAVFFSCTHVILGGRVPRLHWCVPRANHCLTTTGLYCLEASFSLMTDVSITSFSDWPDLFTRDAILLALPGIALGLLLVFVVQRWRHFLVLPCFLLAIPVIFYICLALAGASLSAARGVFGSGYLSTVCLLCNFTTEPLVMNNSSFQVYF
jgi:hypothetical protein